MTTIERLRLRWPELTVDLYPDELIIMMLLEASFLVCVDDSHELYETFLVHMIAHMMTHESGSVKSGNGSVKQKKVGGVTTTYETQNNTDQYLTSTKYGKAYLSLCEKEENYCVPFYTTKNT